MKPVALMVSDPEALCRCGHPRKFHKNVAKWGWQVVCSECIPNKYEVTNFGKKVCFTGD